MGPLTLIVILLNRDLWADYHDHHNIEDPPLMRIGLLEYFQIHVESSTLKHYRGGEGLPGC